MFHLLILNQTVAGSCLWSSDIPILNQSWNKLTILSNALELLGVVYIVWIYHDRKKFIPRFILRSEHPQHPPYSHYKTIIPKITICIDQKSIKIEAQNINNVQYIHMPSARNQQAPPGQTYQLPPNSFSVAINVKIPDRGKRVNLHKVAMGIRHGQLGEAIYGQWREILKDQMVARNFTNLATFADVDFHQIVEDMRRLRHACEILATASAVNNLIGMQQADEAVIQIVKDCRGKLMQTLGNRAAAQLRGAQVPPLGQPGVPPAQVIIPNLLLRMNCPAQWGSPLPVQVGVVQQPVQVAVIQQPAQVAVAPPPRSQGGPASQPQAQVAVGPPPIPPWASARRCRPPAARRWRTCSSTARRWRTCSPTARRRRTCSPTGSSSCACSSHACSLGKSPYADRWVVFKIIRVLWVFT